MKNGSTMYPEFVTTQQNSLCLWMKAQLTIEQRIEGKPGLFMGCQHIARRFLYVGKGKEMPINIYLYLTPCSPHRFSVLPALSYKDGIMHCKILEGSFCMETFQCFIGRLLDYMQPFPAPNSVIVMDNCCIHKHPDILNMIESRFVL